MGRALKIVVVVIALAAIAALVAWNSLDLLVRVAIERFGPDVTGVKMEVKEVAISPRDGRGRITGLDIGNPAGFSAPRAARFAEVQLAIDPATIWSDVVVVRSLTIVSPQITYERGDKVTNLDAIQRSVEAYARRSAGDGKPAEASRIQRKFIVERLTIRNARVLMTNKGLGGQGLTFNLPDVDLRDVGRRDGGATASQVAALVTGTLQQKIALRVLTNVDALRRGGVEGAVDALKNLVK